ncbi:MAG: class I SAM-dependent methyltransferase [Lacipirellulaceae bacterium]
MPRARLADPMADPTTLPPPSKVAADWSPFVERYRAGEWRAPVFRDMVLADVLRLRDRSPVRMLDIGCGRGFDDSPELQRELASHCAAYDGVEPDAQMPLSEVFRNAHRTLFEQARIDPDSYDVACSVMVLEHLETPQAFWDKLHAVLAPGGVFWGFTIDARHQFARVSALMKRTGIKEWYLNRVVGGTDEGRYENYPVHYRSNRPLELKTLARRFSSVECVNFHRVGQLDYYLPRPLRWAGRLADRGIAAGGLPGCIMAVRVVK